MFYWKSFCVALAYTDDIVSVATTASAMCQLLQLCDNNVDNFNILLNASKSKCIVIFPALLRFKAQCSRPNMFSNRDKVLSSLSYTYI